MKKRLKTFWNLITLTILLPCFISSVSPQAKASEVDWIGAVAWSPNGQLIASATSEGSIKLLTANGDLVRVLQDANGIRVSALAWHPNGTRLASVGVSAPTIWDVSTGNDEIVMDFGHSAPILDVDWSPDGTRIATASFDSYPAGVIVWNAVTGEQLFSIADGLVDSVAWSPDSSRLAVGKADGIEIWDPSGTGTLVSTIETSGFQISVDWNPTGNLIAAASVCCPYTAGVVNIFNVATGLLEQTFSEHTDFVSQVAWNPDGTRLASTGYDGAIYIREVAVNQSTLFLQGTSRLSALDWSPDGSQLAFGGESSTFEILQVPNSSSCIPGDPSGSPTYTIAAGDTAGLIAAITAANANSNPDIIELAEGTYNLTAVNNSNSGGNGLPRIRTDITIYGYNATITRDVAAPPFRWLA